MRVTSASDDFADLAGAKKESMDEVLMNFPDRLVKSHALDSMYLKIPKAPEVDYTELSADFTLKLGEATQLAPGNSPASRQGRYHPAASLR